MNFILLINVKMPTIVGILNIYEQDKYNIWVFETGKNVIFQYLTFYEQLKFQSQLSWAWIFF